MCLAIEPELAAKHDLAETLLQISRYFVGDLGIRPDSQPERLSGTPAAMRLRGRGTAVVAGDAVLVGVGMRTTALPHAAEVAVVAGVFGAGPMRPAQQESLGVLERELRTLQQRGHRHVHAAAAGILQAVR